LLHNESNEGTKGSGVVGCQRIEPIKLSSNQINPYWWISINMLIKIETRSHKFMHNGKPLIPHGDAIEVNKLNR